MRTLPTLSVLLALAAGMGQAEAQAIRPCKIDLEVGAYARAETKPRVMQIEQDRCKAVDAAIQEWTETADALASIADDASNAANARHWDRLRALLVKARPFIDKALKAATDNPDVAGAADIVAQLSATNLGYRFQNARLKLPQNLDEAFAELDRASTKDGEQEKAATILATLSQTLRGAVVNYANGLSLKVSATFRKAVIQLAEEDSKARAQELAGSLAQRAAPSTGGVTSGIEQPDPAASWLWGMGERFSRFSAVPGWAFLAFVLGLIGRAGLKNAAKFAASCFALGTVVWLVYVFVPAAVPYLGPLAFAVCATMLGPVRVLFGTGAKPPMVQMPNPQLALAALVVAGMVCFVIAFALPALLVNVLAAAAVMLFGYVLVTKAAKDGSMPFLAGFGVGAAPAPAAGVGLDGLKVADDILHGSAGWGGYADAKQGKHLGALDEPGFALGRLDAVPAGIDERFRFLGHVVTCAPTGAGKGIGAVIPNLLEYPGSALVVDIKGENYAVTARRREELGHKVYVVDPFGVTGAASAGCNFMDRLDVTHPDCISRSAALAECLVIAGKGENAHFDETARGLLQGLMLHVAGLPDRDRRHLGEVRRLLTLDEPDFLGVMADMVADPDAAYGVPARAANTLMSTGDRERGSILSTARRSTAFLDDPLIIATVSRTDFNFSSLKTEFLTVYLVIPPDRLEFYFRYLRVFIGTALGVLTETQKKPIYRVAFFLDEFAQLGRMQSIEKAISLVRGYGIVFWLFVQDLSQLKGAYEEMWQTFMANSAKQFFGTDDFDTAEYISKTLGKATVEYETAGSSRKITELVGSNSENVQYTGRDLLTPDEVMRLGPKAIIIVRGEPPYMLERISYLKDVEYEGQHDPNPYH